MRFSEDKNILRLLPLAAVLAVSLYAAGFWILRPLLAPAPEDYARAAALVRAGWQQHDAVAVRPWWAARIREHLGDLAFIQVRDLASEDLSHFARLWVVLLPGARDRLAGRYRLEEEHDAGRLTVRRYRLGEPVEVRYDFRAGLHEAQVRMQQQGGMHPCSRWVDDRWVCSRRDWNYVGRMIVELGDDPREVIWAHPSDTGPIEIAYREVPGGRTLLVHTGFTPPAARTPGGVPVTLEVLVDGNPLGRVVQDNRTGYFPHAFDLDEHGPGPHAVTFRVSAPQVGMRHFCFDAEVRG